MIRYQSLSKTGVVLAQGKTITSVQGMGNRIIVDYKQKRHAVDDFYPSATLNWINGTVNLGSRFRN